MPIGVPKSRTVCPEMILLSGLSCYNRLYRERILFYVKI
jgi:hypothetical protein